jgi:hypothetical protein
MQFKQFKFKNVLRPELDELDDVDDISEIFLYENRVLRRKIKPKLYNVIVKSLEFKMPEPGWQVELRTQAQINMVGLVLKAISEFGTIDELYITTFSMIRDSYDILLECWAGGMIEKFNLVICSSFSARFPQTYEYIKEVSKQAGINFAYVNNHAKLTLIKAGNNFWNIRGSMNYGINNLGEGLTIDNDVEIYNWDKEFINNTMIKGNMHLKRTEIIKWE